MTQVKSVMGYRARLERAIAGHDENLRKHAREELTSEQIKLARHLAWDECYLAEIAEGIGWKGTTGTLARRLRDLNIYANQMRRSGHKHMVTQLGVPSRRKGNDRG